MRLDSKRQPVRDEVPRFREASQEAEALWGADVRAATDRLDHCVVKLRVGIDALIENAADSGQIFENNRDFGRMIRERVSSLRDDDDNSLNQQIDSAIADIERLASKHR